MERPPRPLLAVLPAVGLFGLGVTAFLLWSHLRHGLISLPLDDGWIHLAFAKGLAAGNGLTLGANPDPVSGSTAPLWTFLLALFLRLGLAPETAALIPGLGASLCALLATAWLGCRLSGSTLGGAVAAGGLALAPRFLWGALSGMEVPLYTALAVWAVHLHLRGRSTWQGVLAAGAAGWARPECFALAAYLAVLGAWRGGRRPEGRLVRLLPPLAAFLAPLLAWVGLHLATYGRPLPSTFYVKAASAFPGIDPSRLLDLLLLEPLRQLAAFAGYIPANNFFLCAGVGLALRRKQTRAPVLTVLGAMAAFAWARGMLGFSGPWLQHGRYFLFLLPLWLCISAAGLAPPGLAGPRAGKRDFRIQGGLAFGLMAAYFLLPGTAGAVTRLFLADAPGARLTGLEPARWEMILPWLLLLPAGVALLHQALTATERPGRGLLGRLLVLGLSWYLVTLPPMAQAYGRNVHETHQAHVGMARWVAEHTPREAVIACHDIGALGFFGERRLLDLAGIATPEVLGWKTRPDGRPDRLDYLRAKKPDFLCVLEGWYPEDLKGLAEDVAAGRLGFGVMHRIDLPGNITLGGEHYVLFGLDWRREKPTRAPGGS